MTTSTLYPIHTLHNWWQYHAFGSWIFHVWIIVMLWICHRCILHWSWKVIDRSWKGNRSIVYCRLDQEPTYRKQHTVTLYIVAMQSQHQRSTAFQKEGWLCPGYWVCFALNIFIWPRSKHDLFDHKFSANQR